MTGLTKRFLTKALLGAHVPLRLFVVFGMLLGMLSVFVPGTSAASVNAAVFSGGAGTDHVAGTLYAKQGAGLTLNVSTTSDTKCVRVSGGATFSLPSVSDKEGPSTWSFAGTALSGVADGMQTTTITTFTHQNCEAKNQGAVREASYFLDNTGPTVTAAVSPQPNNAGWNKQDVTLTWNATDTGAGVGSQPSPATDSVTTAGRTTKSRTVSDLVGNSTTTEVVVRLDKTAPTLTSGRSAEPNTAGWYKDDVTISFPTCADNEGGSGLAGSCPTAVILGEGANQSVGKTVTDIAGNTSSPAGYSGINVDKTAPSLSGAPAAGPDGTNGWYTGDVTIRWTCADPVSNGAQSGIAGSGGSATCAALPDSRIQGEGIALADSASVQDKAGHRTTASSGVVKIDRTAPNTKVTAPSAFNWTNDSVTVTLEASDNLSLVNATYYKVNDGSPQTYTAAGIPFTVEGSYTIAFWSEDNAGNVETARTVTVLIDQTKPSISASATKQDGTVYATGTWTNQNVTVSFKCEDELSLIQSCTAPQPVTTEGEDQAVPGTATDNAGNTNTATATVSIDKTKPSVSKDRSAAPNGAGWYNQDVDVTFTCTDGLSGIADCSATNAAGQPVTGAGSKATVTVGEGQNQSVKGTGTDAAGNADSATDSGINVDKTAPSLSGAPAAGPNGANGWYTGDVTIRWTCADTLSGIAGSGGSPTCPALPDSRIQGEGRALADSASVQDKAGHQTTAPSGTIDIDRTDPSTEATPSAQPNGRGWYTSAVTLRLKGDDNLSGVGTTHYTVNGGGELTYAGEIAFDKSGVYTIAYWSVDQAGNAETARRITLRVDVDAPTIALKSRTPAANANGWNNTDVAVSFDCSDPVGGSSLDSCLGDTTLTQEIVGQLVTGIAVDQAGNVASLEIGPINIDNTIPTIALKSRTPAANANSWNNTDVTVTWDCGDPLSGPTAATVSKTASTDGANQSATGICTDKAGNTNSATVNLINIDKVVPSIFDNGVTAGTPGSNGWYTSAVTNKFEATDTLSGVDPMQATISKSSGTAEGVSVVLSSGAVADLAGNSNSGLSATFKIDLNNPTATITSPADNASTSATSVTVNVNAADTAAGSGVASVMINDGAAMQTSGVYSRSVNLACGKNTITALATDNAGRRSTVAQALVTRTCLTTKGFYQPVDMYDSTGNFIVNTVKGGSTVPLKFEVFNGATEVKEVVVVTSLTYRKVANVTGLPTDEIETVGSGNTALRFDATSDMFIYNWKLPTGIDSYVVTVTLQDGTKIEAMFKTR